MNGDLMLLWFDGSSRELAVKVREAVAYYQKKLGERPDLCLAPIEALSSGSMQVEGVTVKACGTVMRNYLLIGQEAS